MYSNTKKIEALPEGFSDTLGATANRLFPKTAPANQSQVAILEHRLAEVRRQLNAARMGGSGNIGRLSKQKGELEAQLAEAKEAEAAESLMEADLSKLSAAQKRALQKASATAKPKEKVTLKKAPWEKDVKEGMDKPDEDELDGEYDDRKDKDIDNDGDEDDTDEYLHNRRKAISKAMKRKQIDELKKSTLGSYIKKASGRAVSDKTAADRLSRRAFDADKRDDAEKYFDASDRMQKKYKNRLAGIAKATDRLTKEEVDLEEAKSATGYTIYHKTFSSAVQHAKDQVEKQGYTIDGDEWDHKVAMGPKKPSAGKTNKYTIDLMKNGKETRRKLQMQVYYDEGRYELNMYIS